MIDTLTEAGLLFVGAILIAIAVAEVAWVIF
jgi:hypothetical protein